MIHTVEAVTANEMYKKMLMTIINEGEIVKPRGLVTRELRPLVVRLENSLNNIITLKTRQLNYSFMVAEWLWMSWGREDVEMIGHYNAQLPKFSDDGKVFFGAYGIRIVEQLQYVLSTLQSDPDSRQAVMSLWRPNPPKTKDVPCTSLMQFMIRNGKLEAIVTMRSSDVWLGIPYDVFNFTRIQAGIAAELMISPGPITLQLGSSHIYEPNIDAAWTVINEKRSDEADQLSLSPELDGWPPLAMQADEYAIRTGRSHGSDDVQVHATEDRLWHDYLDALHYRNHRDVNLGRGHLMNVIRYVKGE